MAERRPLAWLGGGAGARCPVAVQTRLIVRSRAAHPVSAIGEFPRSRVCQHVGHVDSYADAIYPICLRKPTHPWRQPVCPF